MNDEEKLKMFYEKGMKNCEFFIGATNKGNVVYGKPIHCLAGLTMIMREFRKIGFDEKDLLEAVKLSGTKQDELLNEAKKTLKETLDEMFKEMFGDDE